MSSHVRGFSKYTDGTGPLRFEFIVFILFILSNFLAGCESEPLKSTPYSFRSLKDVPASSLQDLADRKIFFGHQSVGANIIEGIRDIMRDDPRVRLDLVKASALPDADTPAFLHTTVGANTDPHSKIEAFSSIMDGNRSASLNVAFFKFCYIDFDAGTDVGKIFANYEETMNRLAQAHPETLFIHFTVPLTARQTGLKAIVKRMIGWPIGGYLDNIRRNEFNEMMRRRYGGTGTLFDLARIESTLPDGRQVLFGEGLHAYESLAPDYTDDGGHLNPYGRKVVAEQLLVFLAGAGTKR